VGGILTLTGASMSGKTELSKKLMKDETRFTRIVSHTTRRPRPTDAPGEYVYLSEKEFGEMLACGEFLWPRVVTLRGYSYQTARASLETILNPKNPKIGIMILADVLKILSDYAGPERKIFHVFLVRPREKIMETILALPEAEKAAALARINDGRDWETEMRSFGVKYTTLVNDRRIIDLIPPIYNLLGFNPPTA